MLHNKTVEDLLQIKEIYIEPEVKNYKRGQKILTKYPDAKLIEVPSHCTGVELPKIMLRKNQFQSYSFTV